MLDLTKLRRAGLDLGVVIKVLSGVVALSRPDVARHIGELLGAGLDPGPGDVELSSPILRTE